MLFRSLKKKQKQYNSFNKQTIIKQVKNIGVNIDENLTWKEHINLISKKIIKASSIIARIRHFTNLNTLKVVYYALV